MRFPDILPLEKWLEFEIKIAVPIFVGDEFIGTVGACGLLSASLTG